MVSQDTDRLILATIEELVRQYRAGGIKLSGLRIGLFGCVDRIAKIEVNRSAVVVGKYLERKQS